MRSGAKDLVMDRSDATDNTNAEREFAGSDRSGPALSASPQRVPARREVIDLEVTPATGPSIANFVTHDGAKVTITVEGLLGLRFPEGGLIVLQGTDAIPAAFNDQHGILLDILNTDKALFLSVVSDLQRGNAGTDPLAEYLPHAADVDNSKGITQLDLTQTGSSYPPVTSIPGSLASMPGLRRLDAPDVETRQWGRDDLKRGEAGASGRLVDTAVGSALKHLTGLGDEDRGHRNGEKISSNDNALYVGPNTPTGDSLDHLWLLGDIEYLRASRDLDEGDSPFELDGYAPIIWPPIEPIAAFAAVEDTVYTGNLFDPGIMPLPITTWQATIDPSVGTVIFGPKGEFIFTPSPGYSGFAEFTYSFRDPRTGLTISGAVGITVEAVADPATIGGSAFTDEDVNIATPVSIDLNDPDGSEDVEKVVITGLPAGAALLWDTTIAGAGVDQRPDGSFVITGSSADIQALLLSLSVTPPQDFHGRITLGIDVTTIERNVDPALPGYLDRETVHYDYHVDVEAVADLVTATGDAETTDEDTLVHLDDLAATFGDLFDGSETHVVEIRGVDGDAKITDSVGNEYPFTLAVDGSKTYTLNPSQVTDVYFLPPPDESGTFTGMTIVAIATEGSNGDQEIASAPIRVFVNPVADPVTMTAPPPQATDEDTEVVFGDDINIVINDPLTQTLTQVVLAGFPAGTIVTYTPAAGVPPVTVIMPAGGSLTLSGSEADIRAELATVALTPPLHTDQNITINVSATTEDLGGVTNTQTVPMTIAVAAVADGPTISGSASGLEDQPINLPITVSRIDADGSEQYDFAAITIPAGATLIYAVTPPNGITVSVVGNVHTFTPGPATTAAQFQSFLATGLQVQAPADSDVNFNVGVRVGTIESVLSGGEVTLLKADATFQVPVTVSPVTDMPAVTGSSTVDEDTSVIFGANIAITQNDKTDGSEAITQIVVGNIPSTATVTYTASPGVTVTPSTAAGITSYTIAGGSEDAIRATLATFTLQPPLHSDVNIAVSLAITKVDRTTSEAEAAATTTTTYTHNIAVAAVADGPTISGSASGLEDQPINLPITVSRIDADGSEQYDFAAITIPAGATLIYAVTPPNGITVSVVGNVHTFTPGPATTAAQFQSFLATGLQVQAPADSDVNFNVGVRVGTIESVLSGGEVTLLKADATFQVPVTVSPVTDMPAVTGSSTVDEDTSVIFGANIAITQNDKTDGSEAITQIVVGNIPSTATVTYTASPGVTVTPSTAAGITSYTIAGGSEDAIRATLATFTLQPPLHSDVNIAVSLAITKVDRTTSEAEAAATTTTTYTHNIAVAAVADGPTISGSASGLEDQPINLPITVSRIDADGSEQYDFAAITIPAGATLIYAVTPPNGITVSVVGNVHTFTPGPATTAAQFQSFLATGLQVQAPADSDVNFNVGVRVGTIESVLSGGEVTLLKADATFQVPVTVSPVTDMPAVTGSSTVDEDTSVIFGANIAITQNDKTDGSEAITQIVVGNIPSTATVTYTASPGVTVTPSTAAGITSYTIAGGSEDAIRATLATFTLQPPLHSDVNIAVSLAITKVDRTTSEAEAAATTTTTYTHNIAVAAVADTPTASGTGAGFEDQNIPISITVGHPDNSDGTERIKDVVIGNVPAGFTLTESSAGSGTLTLNGNGTYTVAGPNTAAIQDVLSNLTLVFVPGGARQHLDTEFSLSARVTTIESAPTETGTGEVAVLEAYIDISVPVTVTAVADPVTPSGSSTIQEDTNVSIGSNIGYTKIDLDGTESVTTVTISTFPNGTQVTYTDLSNTLQSFTSTGTETITLTGGTEAQIRTALNSLSIQAPPHSDQNFNLAVTVTTTDNDASTNTTSYNHSVIVQAIADAPTVSADAITFDEDTSATLTIRPNRSADEDNSETLSVRITVPSDGAGVIGTLNGTPPSNVTLTAQGGGVYLVTATGTAPADRETLLDTFLNGGITFTPRANYSGALSGTNGIQVDAISTEAATGGELAANSFGGLDNTSKTETVTTYIAVTVNPINDIPVLTNATTIVQENNGSTSASDPDLSIPIGTRLGLTIADVDGSQGLDLTLTGFPVNAQALAFGITLPGVSTSVVIATGTVTITGTNANNVITVLNSLSITLADDRDENFTVTVNGTVTDNNGATTDTDTFTLTHMVTVQAVADVPTVNVGATTKPAVNEDSAFVTYAVTTALNDTDGSETYQRVTVAFSTPGSGARPEVQFGTIAGVIFDTATPGQVVLTGPAADINAAMASLQVRPGANNGENITITVTARAIESAPAEDNDGATAGMGGGIAGPEIATPIAQTVASFTIPVTPVPEVPTLSIPASASGTEDTTFALGAITVSSVTTDTDNSETRFFEIQQSSYPAGTQFISGGVAVGTVVTPGWLRVTEAQLATLSILPSTNYSGTINLVVRGVVIDTNAGGSVTSTTATQTLPVTVAPDADGVTTPTLSSGVEDNGAIAVGSDINSGMTVVDNATGTGNNATSETISRIVLDFPADTATQTYSIVPGTASGTAEIAFDSATRVYTITSTIITGAADIAALTQVERAQAETDIRAALAGFRVTMGPTHTDLNGLVSVTATTLDVNGGVSNTQDNAFNHSIRVQAVADTPSISVVDPVSFVTEDGATVALTINAGNSADTDNSETLSVRITLPSDSLGPIGTIVGSPPSGVTVTYQGSGIYLVTATGTDNATREARLDSFLNGGGIAFDPRNNWGGVLLGTNGIKVEVISTEGASGPEVAANSFGGTDNTSQTETVTDYIDVRVSSVPDAPTIKGNGVGIEDTRIPIPISVTLADKDGSETYVVTITGGVPAGAKIFGAGGLEILPSFGEYVLTPADVAALAILPPVNYSSVLQGNITLDLQTAVTDSYTIGSLTNYFYNNIEVSVTGVADAPGTRTVAVSADEDETIELGAAIVSSAGGNLNSLLVDNDGSEALSFVIGGLPQGVIPTSAVAGVTYLGNGTWSITAAAMPTLQLPPVSNFSGENPYSGVTVRAVTQELDGDEASSSQWPVTITVSPVINSTTVDGLANWNMGVTQAEAASESGIGISLASAANHAYIDNDGSEAVVSYTFNLSSLLADAGIAARLTALDGAGADLDDLVSNHIFGPVTYDSVAGTITVLAADIGGVVIDGALFLDSNQDFSIPVTAVVRDEAILGGTPTFVDKIETGTFNINLIGSADTPTAFATSTSGASGSELVLNLGGVSTDTDAALGRALSEDIYYVVAVTNPGAAPALGFTDGSGNVVGLDNGDGTWVFTPADFIGLHILTVDGASGTANLRLTSIAVENDGDTASNTANFTVTVVPGTGGPGGNAPQPPLVSIGTNSGNEDGSITLNVTAGPAPGDTSNPSVSVMISNLPAGAQIEGARYNPDTGRWVASAALVNSGAVKIIPPADFSGTMNITIEAVATNASLQRTTTGATTVPIAIDPVADGVAISASPDAGVEDLAVNLDISLAERDVDGSEVIGGSVYVRLSDGAAIIGGYPVVAAGDSDATIDGTSLIGFYRVPTSALSGLQLQPAANWHGTVTVQVASYSIEPVDLTPDADNTQLDVATFAVTVTASADAPAVSAPISVTGDEDNAISIAGLSAALVDNIATNGAEVLSVKISGVAAGTRFSTGSNNGDGSWTIPVTALSTLQITPPLHYSGTMTLTLTAIALELANGDEAQSSVNFNVIVAPKADTVEILAENVAVDATGSVLLDLNVRMADGNGINPGENAAESIRITFSSVPTGLSLAAAGGGTITNPSTGTWIFTGSEAQANAIEADVGAVASGGTYTVSLSAVTLDGPDTLATPVTDTFQLTVPQVLTGDATANTLTGAAGTQLMFGLGGADILNGGADADFLVGGAGADTLTGGGGRDRFGFGAGDLGSGVDTITDFATGSGGDALDVAALLSGFSGGTSVLSDFVQITQASGNSTIRIDANGGGDSFQNLVILQGVTGLDVNTLRTNGNLIV